MVEAQAEDVTERIKRAALRRFAEVGYGSATVEEIAALAGVGVATLYRRWPDKAALGNALLTEYLTDLERLYESIDAPTPKRRFQQMWQRLWDVASGDPDRFVFGEAHVHASFVSPEIAARKASHHGRSAEVLAELGMGASPETATAILLGTVTAAVRDGLDVDPDDLGERLWAALRPG